MHIMRSHRIGTRAALFLAAVAWMVTTACAPAATEALDWNLQGRTNITCVYGEITVLTSVPGIYFCGAQWSGVGGYCGIQHNEPTERRTIFSVWDTSSTKHPRVIAADSKTVFSRFGGEGEGAHTHMVWPWKYGETFTFFLRKQPGVKPGTTDVQYYVRDPSGKWLHSATISSPNGGRGRGTTFEGICSWIENFAGADVATPKIALYSLWTGSDIDGLKHVTRTGGESGSGRWGRLRDAYFLAEGHNEQIAAALAKWESKYGKPVYGTDGTELEPVPERPLPPSVLKALRNLPAATPVKPQ